MAKVLKAGMVIHPVEDLDRALGFYRDALGPELQFRDGDRFAALSAGPTTVALAAGDERLSDAVMVSYKVEDVDATLRDLARNQPQTPDDFLLIHGVGEKKLEDFGESFMEKITKFKN